MFLKEGWEMFLPTCEKRNPLRCFSVWLTFHKFLIESDILSVFLSWSCRSHTASLPVLLHKHVLRWPQPESAFYIPLLHWARVASGCLWQKNAAPASGQRLWAKHLMNIQNSAACGFTLPQNIWFERVNACRHETIYRDWLELGLKNQSFLPILQELKLCRDHLNSLSAVHQRAPAVFKPLSVWRCSCDCRARSSSPDHGPTPVAATSRMYCCRVQFNGPLL